MFILFFLTFLLNFEILFLDYSWDKRDNENETFYFVFAYIGLEAPFEVGAGPPTLVSEAPIGHCG